MNIQKSNRYRFRWDYIGVWTLILLGCFGTLFGIGTMLISACTPLSPQGQAKTEIIKEMFALPQIPITINNPTLRAEWLAVHYWDNFDFADTTWINQPDRIEQAFADYIDLLPHTTSKASKASLGGMLTKAYTVPPVFNWFAHQFDKYLYDPNSPFRNEEMYAMVVDHIIADLAVDSLYKIRPSLQLEEINKNRLGKLAADFTYTLPSGKRATMHNIHSEYTLLFFNNPDCGDCKRTKDVLAHTEVVSKLVRSERMKILAVYTDDDLSLWKAGQKDMPTLWLYSHDASEDRIVKHDLYAIRAIPSLYLLDKDKRVLLKDATAEQVITYLTRLPASGEG